MQQNNSHKPLSGAIPVIGSVILLLIGNEIISLAVLSVLAFIGIGKLFGAIAEVGNW